MGFPLNDGSKRLEALTPEDLAQHPVWRIVPGGTDEPLLTPIRRVRAHDLAGKLVATQLHLANGSRRWGLLGNIKVENVRLTRHFVAASVYDAGRWFHLARYHDPDYEDHGPDALAEFLGLAVDDVFPIEYDIGRYVSGDPEVLQGLLTKRPLERLSRAELIALAVP